MLEKSYELNLDLHLLFIAFGQAYDAINRTYLFGIFKEFGITKKIVNVMKMTLSDSHEKVKIHFQVTEVFGIERGSRQDAALPKHCQYFIGERDEEYRDSPNETIFNRTRQDIAHAGDVWGRCLRVIEEVVTQSKAAAVSTGLEIRGKTTE